MDNLLNLFPDIESMQNKENKGNNSILPALLSLLQNNQPRQVETANVGGHNLLVNRSGMGRASNVMGNMANKGLGVAALAQQGNQQQAFKQELGQALQEPDPEKQLQAIMAVGTKYGGFMGMKDQVKMYVDNLTKMSTKTQKKGTMLAGDLAPQKVPRLQKGTGQYTGGFLNTGFGKQEKMADVPAWNAETQHVASKIATKEDVVNIIQNRDYYANKGVDVDALLQYIQANMLYKPKVK